MLNKTIFNNLVNKLFLLYPIFINNAYAASSSSTKSSISGEILFFALLFGVMYFVMIRPQTQRAKEHRNLLSNITTGDEVVTNGGLLGKVSKVVDKFFVLAIADGVEVVVQKQAVVAVLPNGTIKAL